MRTWNGIAVRGLLLAMALGWVSACSNDETAPSNPCPAINDPGPVVSGAPYLLVANSLGETWQAIPLGVPPLSPLPDHGQTGASPNDLDVVGDLLYITNSGDNTVVCFDLGTGLPIGCVRTGDNTNPWQFFLDPADESHAWVTAFLSGELLELDLQTLTVSRRVTVGAGVEGVWASDSVVVVTLTGYNGAINQYESGAVAVYQKSNLVEIARRDVPPNAQFAFEGADNRVHVVCTGNYTDVAGQVVRVDPSGWTVVDTLALGGSPGSAILAPNGTAYVSGFFGGLLSYDTVTFQALNDSGNPILTDTGLGGLAISNGVLYVTDFDSDTVRMVQIPSNTDQGSVNVGDGPVALAVTAP